MTTFLSHPDVIIDGVRTCRLDDCDRGGKLRLGLCERHYVAQKRYGNPYVRLTTEGMSIEDRLRIRSTQEGECRLWVGKTNPVTGYGSIKIAGQMRLVHRIAYELAKGPIPDGLVIDHLCRNRTCIESRHLEAVTQRENVHRGWAAVPRALRPKPA